MKTGGIAIAAMSTIACAAHAQDSGVQIYGIVDARMIYTSKVAAPEPGNTRNTGSKLAGENGLPESSRIDFRGKEDLAAVCLT